MPPWKSRNVCPQALVRGGNGIRRRNEDLFRKAGAQGEGKGEMVVIQR
jgi:hypothetical protein